MTTPAEPPFSNIRVPWRGGYIGLRDLGCEPPPRVTQPSLYRATHVFPPGAVPFSNYAIVLTSEEGETGQVLLRASGGPTCAGKRSLVVDSNYCLVAVGHSVAKLTLPDLDLVWTIQVDEASCFGLIPFSDGLLVAHGELSISVVTTDGRLVWSRCGADIFSEGCELDGQVVEAVDIDHRVYRFDIITGMPV